ncbi:BA75_04600T0 [Komagataella pastoris]|uniref:Multiple RNA-binding domain-containing protein 1 n=1 Tax=Komagataella pastoris TaxID=4922 RepID=A0A1B2JIQ2_PICPA|nr:BA75_04600T0 [Komagataella pastoris]
MSRLIVKGLPKYYTEDKLKIHFSKQGDVSDVKLMKNRFGESRRFAFIGYKNAEDAEKAVSYFNDSFIDTARISVELAVTFADSNVPLSFKAKKRLAEDRIRDTEEKLKRLEEAPKKKNKINPIREIDEQIAKDHKLRDFMNALRPGSQTQTWADNSTVSGEGGPTNEALVEALAKNDKSEPTTESVQHDPNVSDHASDNEYDDFQKPIEDDKSEDEEEMIPLSEVAPGDDSMTDLEWLIQRRKRMTDNPSQSEQNGNKDTEEKKPRKEEEKETATQAQDGQASIQQQPEIVQEEESEDIQNIRIISQTGRLFVRNISYTATEAEFRQLFSAYGELDEVHVAIDTRTGASKGFVYVKFQDPDQALEAYQALDKQIFQGRLLHILPAQPKKDHRLDEFDIKNLPLKKQRELKKKVDASKSVFSWNSLYMNNDAVLSSVADKLGISKTELIDPQNSSSAVKQALAEAHVIGDVRKYFESKGVDLTKFDTKERDDRVVLVKNFPYGTSLDEITDLFAQYGELKRVLMPPAGTIAVVEFRDAPSGRSAFTKLAYRRFKKSIMYLEKGPTGLFTRDPNATEAPDVAEKKEGKEAKVTGGDLLDTDKSDEAVTPSGPTVSVFVKNLSFSTTVQTLTDTFKPLEGFTVATVKTKPDAKNPGKSLSMGFGFVEFRTKEQAELAISTLDGTPLDGHRLQLKLSHRKSGTNEKRTKSSKTSKIIIKNLPFEATRKDIVELFSSFGHLKSARVPKKFDSSARGFAFVEFSLLKEAEQAMDQLQGVHLLGRRLVMEYAQQDAENAEEEIERMTKKVQKQVASRELASLQGSGRKRLDFDETNEFEGL